MKKVLLMLGMAMLLVFSVATVSAEEVTQETGWVSTENGWQYVSEEGIVQGKEFVINDKTYLFNDEGYLATGFVTSDNKTYYYNENSDSPENGLGEKVKGLQNINNSKYYFDSDYSMQYGFKNISNKKYYFASNGQAVTGLKKISSKYYYFNNAGVMETGWKKINNKKYYFYPNGQGAVGLKKISSKYYYFSNYGVMQTGWKKVNNKVYNFSSNGSANIGLKKINSKYYYFNKNGTTKTGWTNVNKKTYYLSESGKFGKFGASYVGLKKIGSNKYYFNDKGVLQTGLVKYKKNYYIFKTTGKVGTKGKMLTDGWQTLNNKYYYAKSNGQLVTNTYYNGYKFTKSACLDSQSAFVRKSVVNTVASKTKGIKSKAKKLQALYNYVSSSNVYKHLSLDKDDVYYAYQMFKYHKGNCYAYASQLTFLAREIGYDANVFRGRCSGGRTGTTPHGWCELKISGKKYVCDPDLQWELKLNGFMKTYGRTAINYYTANGRLL